MIDLDLLLRRWLPRPEPDPVFRAELEQLILAGAHQGDAIPLFGDPRRRLCYIGGAVVGAALAVGAATVGWLKWGRTWLAA